MNNGELDKLVVRYNKFIHNNDLNNTDITFYEYVKLRLIKSIK